MNQTNTLQGITNTFAYPWQIVNPNSAQTMQDVYNPVQNTNAINIAQPQAVDQQGSITSTTKNEFGKPNWNYIFGSQMIQGFTNGFAKMNPNSRQNAAQRFNQEQFNPLNYLPSNPNTSIQDLYGMKKGGALPPEMVAISNVLSQRNKDLNWVDRGLHPERSPYMIDPETGNRMTHKLAYGNDDKGFYVFPNVIQNEDGSMQDLDPDEAHGWARETNTTMRVPTEAIAKFYSEQGLIRHPDKKRKGGKIKFEEGGEAEDQEDFDFLFDDDEDGNNAAIDLAEQMSKRDMRKKARAESDQIDAANVVSQMDFLNSMLSGNTEQLYSPRKRDSYSDENLGNLLKERMVKNGIPEHIASGFVGNFVAESSLNPGVTNSIGAFGLGQWLGSRKKDLNNFAKQQGKSASDPLVQADFVSWELQNTEKNAAKKIFESKDPIQAATSIMNYYERPSKSEAASSAKKRVENALKFREGGEYDIDKAEVERLRKLGYTIEIL